MKLCIKYLYWTFLFVVAMLVQNASAMYGDLPSSSFALGKWQGTKNYNSGGFNVLVDYTVYNTHSGNELALAGKGWTNPGSGQYVYAYQVFRGNDSSNDVGAFEIFGLPGNAITQNNISGQGSQDDTNGKGGIKPSDSFFDVSTNQVVWNFGNAKIIKNSQSWFLLYSSDSAPVVGGFNVQANPFTKDGDFPAPGTVTNVPEPLTIALLGFGGAFLFRRSST